MLPDVVLPQAVASRTPAQGARWSRRRGATAVFAWVAAAGFLGAYIVPATAALAEGQSAQGFAAANETTSYSLATADAQSIAVTAHIADTNITRDSYALEKAAPAAVAATTAGAWAPPVVAVDPGSAQGVAQQMLAAQGLGDDQFSCLVALWSKESGWRVNAHNASSGAYGIPQALPGGKMASAGADWETNAATQIRWGLGYITGRYGTPCGAWGHSQSKGWY